MRVVLIVVLGILVGSCVWAAKPPTLKLGEYKLQWMDQDQNSDELGPEKDFRKMTADEVKRCPGLVSADCSITDGPLRVIVDESKGTGTGYDTLYYIPPSVNSDEIDFSRAVKMSLRVVEGSKYVLSAANPLTFVEWPVGKGTSRQLKKMVGGGLNVKLPRPDWGTSRMRLLPSISGHWSGKIDTDQGQVSVSLIDHNWDGIYGQKVRYDREFGDMMPADEILIGDGPNLRPLATHIYHTMFLGKGVTYEGKLYDLKVSSSGETITVLPYDGGKGKLLIDARDSRGKPFEYVGALAINGEGIYTVRGALGTELPTGTYNDMWVLIGPDAQAADDRKFRFYQHCPGKLKIDKGKTVTLRVGGRMTLDIQAQQGAKISTVKAGGNLSFEITPMIGKECAFMFDDEKHLNITVKDAGGRVVHSSQVKQSYGGFYNRAFECSLAVPQDWDPGLYTIIASYPGEPYQDVITGTRQFRVTK